MPLGSLAGRRSAGPSQAGAGERGRAPSERRRGKTGFHATGRHVPRSALPANTGVVFGESGRIAAPREPGRTTGGQARSIEPNLSWQSPWTSCRVADTAALCLLTREGRPSDPHPNTRTLSGPPGSPSVTDCLDHRWCRGEWLTAWGRLRHPSAAFRVRGGVVQGWAWTGASVGSRRVRRTSGRPARRWRNAPGWTARW